MRAGIKRFASSRLREFPWRRVDIEPYEYTVTEILLQQTQAKTVAEFTGGFFERFDSWDSLQSCDVEDIARHLRPLGLQNQRAKRLHALARAVTEIGSIPVDYESLLGLPGISFYVASAIATRFGSECHVMLDVNIARVFERYFDLRIYADFRKDKELRELANQVVRGGNCLQYNWALLDIAALHCRRRNPNHEDCPLCNSNPCTA